MSDENRLLQYDGLSAARMSPDQRRRLGNALMAEQYNRMTPQDSAVTDRASILPLGTYANGQTGIAWPGIIAQPFEQMNRILKGEITPGTPEFIEAGNDIAGAAMVGGLAAARPRGSLGSSGRPTPGLDMSHAARMNRADAMEFHPSTFYHGTIGAFPEFDLTRGGQVSSSRAGLQGVSVTPSPSVANEFAHIASDKSGGGASVMPLRARLGKTAQIELDGTEKNLEVAASLSNAFQSGYDTVALRNYTTPGGSSANTVLVVKDPAQLRSVNAAFDPALKDSRNLLAANARPGAALGAGLNAARETPGIRAYHGSPHDFDRFDMSKIGTGEGAQAYGHGLYFAESEGVAKSYRERLANSVLTVDNQHDPSRVAGKFMTSSGGRKELAALELESVIDEITRMPAMTSQTPSIREYAKQQLAAHEAALELVKSGAAKQNGRMYEVNIKANADDFLDWDRPLSQQSEKVRAAIASTPWGEPYVKSETLTGGQIVPRTKAGQQQLREAGIPGIRYLDQGSRAAGEGSRNYVVFDENLIEILRKYGLLGMLGAGGMVNDLTKPTAPKMPDDAA